MIAVAPGFALWDVAQHAAWLAPIVIAVTAACAVATPILVALCWRKPAGLRCVLAVVLGLALVVAARHAAETLVFVPRPFVADHFRPLFPHAPDSSFPSATTGYFAAAAIPVPACWRRVGWILAAIAAEVAAGCVYVGVHYVTDVLAGLTIGAAAGAAAWLAFGAPGITHLITATDAALQAARLRPRATGEAASLLGVSRRTPVRLLEAGEVQFRQPGRHRRVRLADLLAYQQRARRGRTILLDQMVADSEAAGLYDLPDEASFERQPARDDQRSE